MGNVFRVFARDVMRLFKAPAALVVVVALIILPSLYTWFNVEGFFNPYENTQNLRVCVVNEDEGASSELMGDLDLGDQIVEELQTNEQLGWVFTDRETAMYEVHSGKSYAVFVIPEGFSKDFTTLLSSDRQQPRLEYYVNEKAGAVSPKITDTGATTLDQTINSEFVSTASKVIADKVDSSVLGMQDGIDTAKSGVAVQFARAQAAAEDARSAIAGLNDASVSAMNKTQEARDSLGRARQGAVELSGQLENVSDSTVTVQNKLSAYSTSLFSALDESSIAASNASIQTSMAVANASATLVDAQGDVRSAISIGRGSIAQSDAIIAELQTFIDTLPDTDPNKAIMQQVCDDLTAQNENLNSALSDMERISGETESVAGTITSASEAANTSIQGSLESAAQYRTVLSSTTIPTLNTGLSQIGGSAGSLAVAVSNQTLLIDQATLALNQLTGTLETTRTALAQTDELLLSLEGELNAARTDLVALGSSNVLMDLLGESTVDASKIASFMMSPTQVRTESLYPLNAYGSAMAPLFTNLTLWIGVFMLMVILKQEVDPEGIPNLKPWQSYLSRFLFLAPLVAMQAIICCAGNLIIGVQTVDVARYFLTAIVSALTYLSLQYMLSTTMQHIGKGICVVLVFIQIPGATGLYPVEMTTSFFQMTYPLFPFTYGISAMRETIAGFYSGQWELCIGVLLAFLAVTLAVGMAVRPLLTNLNRMFARQISESNILNSEDVQLPPRRYRLGQVMSVLYNKDEFRETIDTRTTKFLNWYPRLKRVAWIAGFIVPMILTGILAFFGVEKVVILTVWLGWLVVVIAYAVILEHLHNNIERQAQLGEMGEDELREIFFDRETKGLAAQRQGDDA